MRTIISSLALVACATVFAQNTAAPTPQQDPVPQVQSIYGECLLAAGTSTWETLGLNGDQITRVTALQTRYKQDVQAAKEKALADEKAAAKGKGKVKKEAEAKAPVTEPTQVAPTTSQKVEEKQLDPAVKSEAAILEPPVDVDATLEEGVDFSAATAKPLEEYSPFDAEFRAVLTPGQLTLWERRCDTRTSMQP